ncbi:hypothetical protein ACCT09_14345, partial [Rhizobium ruizarguesonis]
IEKRMSVMSRAHRSPLGAGEDASHHLNHLYRQTIWEYKSEMLTAAAIRYEFERLHHIIFPGGGCADFLSAPLRARTPHRK